MAGKEHYTQMMACIEEFEKAPNENANRIFELLDEQPSDTQSALYQIALEKIIAGPQLDWKPAFKRAVCAKISSGRWSSGLVPDTPEALRRYIRALRLDGSYANYHPNSRESLFEHYLAAYSQTQSKHALKKAVAFYLGYLKSFNYEMSAQSREAWTCQKFFELAAQKSSMNADQYLEFIHEFIQQGAHLGVIVLRDHAVYVSNFVIEAHGYSQGFKRFAVKSDIAMGQAWMQVRDFPNEKLVQGVVKDERANFLGSGTYANVFQGSATQFDTKIAIKELRVTEYTMIHVEEAWIHSTCVHPNIVRFLGLEPDGQTLYTELAERENVKNKLDAGKLTQEDVLPIATGIANGMNYLHQQGILWCDPKPENVLLSGGQPLLTDFNTAKLFADLGKHPADIPLYTLYYRPLEAFAANSKEESYLRFQEYLQARDKAADAKPDKPEKIPNEQAYGLGVASDVYAFAIMLWGLFALEKAQPFTDTTKTIPRPSKYTPHNDSCLKNFIVQQNGRLNPEYMNAPEPVKKLFLIASSHNPIVRPDMGEACKVLQALAKPNGKT